MIKRLLKLLPVLIVIICLLFPQQGFTQNAVVNADGEWDADYFKSVMDMVMEKYNGEVTDKQLMEGALKGMLGSMDPYTTYFTIEEVKSFQNAIGGTYQGIGIQIEKIGDYTTVLKVFISSPAERAGILPGDKIVSVDGKSAIGSPVEEVANLIRGKDGTKVSIGLIKNNKRGIITFDVIRKEISINPVTFKISNGIAYVKLDVFNSNTDECMTKALKEIDGKGIKKLILDLRDNPGGEVNQAVAVARKFVPEGLITKLEFKSIDQEDTEYYSYLKKPKYKLAVLVNKNSASASEILAGAIQDTEAGKLIGTKTFGKAKVQNLLPILTPEAYRKYEEQLNTKIVNAYDLINKHGILPLENEIVGYTKITTGIYTTPKGRMIDQTGLTPDIVIADYELLLDIDVNSIQLLTKTSKPTLNSESVDVYNAEKILKLIGYDIDTPDTKLDAKTAKAIDKFRRDSRLYPGSVLDFTTQNTLNDRLNKLIPVVDRQYAKAVEILKAN